MYSGLQQLSAASEQEGETPHFAECIAPHKAPPFLLTVAAPLNPEHRLLMQMEAVGEVDVRESLLKLRT